jgi:hypothetical protein
MRERTYTERPRVAVVAQHHHSVGLHRTGNAADHIPNVFAHLLDLQLFTAQQYSRMSNEKAREQ